MTKRLVSLLLATGLAGASIGLAAATPAKKVVMYEATKCHMLYTPAMAKSCHYVCPGSHSHMKRVMVTPAAAQKGLAATKKELAAGKKKMHMM